MLAALASAPSAISPLISTTAVCGPLLVDVLLPVWNKDHKNTAANSSQPRRNTPSAS